MASNEKWLKNKIKLLEEKCQQLEMENSKLKESIILAIKSLEDQNENTKKYINDPIFKPNFKNPKWLK